MFTLVVQYIFGNVPVPMICRDMAECKVEKQGNIFRWNLDNSWEISNDTSITSVELKTLCQRDILMVSVNGQQGYTATTNLGL
jgi:hypothetical protein